MSLVSDYVRFKNVLEGCKENRRINCDKDMGYECWDSAIHAIEVYDDGLTATLHLELFDEIFKVVRFASPSRCEAEIDFAIDLMNKFENQTFTLV